MWMLKQLNEVENLKSYKVGHTDKGEGLPTYTNKPLGEHGIFRVPDGGLVLVIRRHETLTDYFLVEYKGRENINNEDVWIDGNGHFYEWVEDTKPEPEPIVEYEELLRIGKYFLGKYV